MKALIFNFFNNYKRVIINYLAFNIIKFYKYYIFKLYNFL